VDKETRERVFTKYNARDDMGKPINGWPAYGEGILTPAEIAEIERRNEYFKWESRGEKIVAELLKADADVISLVENDKQTYFAERLRRTWDSVFHKRPREASPDGCSIFWRSSKFRLEASYGLDFVDGMCRKGREKRDRSCLMVLLRWIVGGKPLVIVSTHLAKDPYDPSQTATRVRQVAQIMEGLTEFTLQHRAYEAPVILMGDLNARHFGEIRGIARTVWQVKGSRIHKFLWNASDVPTGPTSITEARQARIDVVQYMSSQLEILEVKDVPKLSPGDVIPNETHPSDHFPVGVTFLLKDDYQINKACARAWLECVAGREKVHPLTDFELRNAFEFFDRDRSDLLDRNDLEEACCELGSTNFDVDVQRGLLECFPDQTITWQNFVRAYEALLTAEKMRCIGDLEYAFKYFARGSGRIQVSTLEKAFREICPISFSDEEVSGMIARLEFMEGDDGEDTVDLNKFCKVVANASFPHRDRRKFTKRDGPVDKMDAPMTASSEFQLTQNLAQMHCKLQKTGSNDTIIRESSSPLPMIQAAVRLEDC